MCSVEITDEELDLSAYCELKAESVGIYVNNKAIADVSQAGPVGMHFTKNPIMFLQG